MDKLLVFRATDVVSHLQNARLVEAKDQLPLRNCEDPKAYIEIYIKAKMLDSKESATPSGMKTSHFQSFSLPAIEEKNSDFEAKEEFERLEIEYNKTIKRLESNLDGL